VGLVLALDLAQRGVACVVVNSGETPRAFPKGNTHNARTMEHYRRLGVAADVRRVGLPPDHPTDVGYFTRLNGHELARIRMPSSREKLEQVARAGVLDQTPEPIHRANQMHVEAILFEHARALPEVELMFGWECVDLTERDDEVSVGVVAGDRRKDLRCRYLVGCDGGQSFVRRRLGIRYEGEGTLDQPFFGGTMVSTHLRIPSFYEHLQFAPCWQYWTVNPSFRTLLYTLDGVDEFLLQTRMARDEAANLVRQSVGADVELEVLGQGEWTAGQALVAESFGRGRVLLCGDAAHLFTPTGGFGMNTGIDDAANLAWKLAAVVQGWGGPDLLATYETERKPIAVRNTTAAHRFARNVGEVPVSPAMDEDSADGDAARREAGEFLSTFGEEFASLGIQLGARYDGSPLVVPDGSPPPDDPVTYVPSACPGGRAPHFRLPDGSSLFDRLGSGFTLLSFGAPDDGARGLESAAQARGIPFTVVEVDVPEARELYERRYALIRPDQHIAWRGDAVPDDATDVDDLLDHVTGRRNPVSGT
jgi:2-polyprenyl-6-methoxyphenol hydroxylase-like FAD-dependent oxidoreductase